MSVLLSIEKLLRAWPQAPRSFLETDIILASYPKSGNTWLRFILSNITKSLSQDPAEVDFHTVNYFSPHVAGANQSKNGYKEFSNSPRFLKTHFYHIPPFSKYRSLLLIRDPIETLESFYDYQKYEIGKDVGDIESFVKHWRSGIRGWEYFYRTWDKRYTVLVRYEELKSDPLRTVTLSLSQLGVDIDQSVVKEAIDLSTRERMRELLDERGDPFRKTVTYDFVRQSDGVDRSAKITPHSLIEIRRVAGRLAEQYGYKL